MDISIACCTYNGSRFLSQQLDSIVNQTKLPDEIVVCDDCSTDTTRDILLHYADEYSNIKWVLAWNDHRLGVRRNFEKAISLASGRYIATCDQDDVWRKDKLEKLYNYINETGCSLVHSDTRLIDNTGHELASSGRRYSDLSRKHYLSEYILGENDVTGCTMMFNSSLKKLIFPFPTHYYYHDQWLAIWACRNGGIGFIDQPLIDYRQHGNNVVASLCGGGNKSSLTYTHFIGKSKDLFMVLRNSDKIGLSSNEIASVLKRLISDVIGFGYLKSCLR